MLKGTKHFEARNWHGNLKAEPYRGYGGTSAVKLTIPGHNGVGQNFPSEDLGDLIEFLQKIKEEVDAPETRHFKALRTLYMKGISNIPMFIQDRIYEGTSFDRNGELLTVMNEEEYAHHTGNWSDYFEEV